MRRFAAIAVVGMVMAMVPGVASAGRFSPQPLSYQANDVVRGIDYGPNGTAFIVGQFTKMRPQQNPPGVGEVNRNRAAALNPKTGDLLKWNPNVNGTVYSVLVDGTTVYLAGNFTSVGGVKRTNLAAVNNSNGDVLPWNPKTSGPVRVIVKGPNGNLFIGGGFGQVNGASRKRIAELTPAGTVTSWSPNVGQVGGFACPPRCSPVVFTIDFSTDGKTVYFGGHFGLVNEVSRNEVAAVPIDDDRTVLPYNPNVYADANCPTCTTNETSRVYHMIVTSSKVYMCGGFWKVYGTRRAYNIYVTDLTTGRPDSTFAAGNDGDSPGCALVGNVFYMGGHFNYVGPICSPNPPGGKGTTKCTAENGSTTRHHVAAVNATTGAILPWNPNANSNHGLWTIEPNDAGSVVGFGGYQTKIGGSAQEGIALYSGDHLA